VFKSCVTFRIHTQLYHCSQLLLTSSSLCFPHTARSPNVTPVPVSFQYNSSFLIYLSLSFCAFAACDSAYVDFAQSIAQSLSSILNHHAGACIVVFAAIVLSIIQRQLFELVVSTDKHGLPVEEPSCRNSEKQDKAFLGNDTGTSIVYDLRSSSIFATTQFIQGAHAARTTYLLIPKTLLVPS
jgi:hypothetical protein